MRLTSKPCFSLACFLILWAKDTLPPDADAWPAQPDGRGGVRFIVDHKTLDRLTALRGPGESYSDVIMRLASEGGRRA